MLLLHPVHVEGWRKGNEHYRVLEQWMQVGQEKFQKAIRHFQEWVNQRGLRPIQANYTRRGPHGLEELRITENGDPEREKFYRTHYAPADLSEKKTTRLAQKLAKPPELVVFEKVSDEGNCSECGAELAKGDFLLMEKVNLFVSRAQTWTISSFFGAVTRRFHGVRANIVRFRPFWCDLAVRGNVTSARACWSLKKHWPKRKRNALPMRLNARPPAPVRRSHVKSRTANY